MSLSGAGNSAHTPTHQVPPRSARHADAKVVDGFNHGGLASGDGDDGTMVKDAVTRLNMSHTDMLVKGDRVLTVKHLKLPKKRRRRVLMGQTEPVQTSAKQL